MSPKPAKLAHAALVATYPSSRTQGRVWLARPADWFAGGAYLESSAYSAEYLIVKPFLMALYVPAPTLDFVLVDPLNAPGDLIWPGAGAGADALLEYVRIQLSPWLDRYLERPRSVAEEIARSAVADLYALEICHASYLLERLPADAGKALTRLARDADRGDIPWGSEVLARASELDRIANASHADLEMELKRRVESNRSRLRI